MSLASHFPLNLSHLSLVMGVWFICGIFWGSLTWLDIFPAWHFGITCHISHVTCHTCHFFLVISLNCGQLVKFEVYAGPSGNFQYDGWTILLLLLLVIIHKNERGNRHKYSEIWKLSVQFISNFVLYLDIIYDSPKVFFLKHGLDIAIQLPTRTHIRYLWPPNLAKLGVQSTLRRLRNGANDSS